MLRRNTRPYYFWMSFLVSSFMNHHHRGHFVKSYLVGGLDSILRKSSRNGVSSAIGTTTRTSPPSRMQHFNTRLFATSVTGPVYTSDDPNAPVVRLFTKEGCTLCDKVKDVLQTLQASHPHSLELVDITDAKHRDWFDRYKYDIPVLHVNGQYWIKHRMTQQEAVDGLNAVRQGTFTSPPGEPNAAAMEQK